MLDTLLGDYVAQAAEKGYRRITYEQEAYRTEETIRRGYLRDEIT